MDSFLPITTAFAARAISCRIY